MAEQKKKAGGPAWTVELPSRPAVFSAPAVSPPPAVSSAPVVSSTRSAPTSSAPSSSPHDVLTAGLDEILNRPCPDPEDPDSDNILDRHEKAIADILKRFLNMVVAATEPIDEGYTPEKASLNQMQMQTETAALVKAIENLLQITREIKRLWITGPLRSTPETDRENKERDAAIDAKTERICGLFNQWITKREEQQRAAARAHAQRKLQLQLQQQGGGGSHDGGYGNSAAADAAADAAGLSGAGGPAARAAAAGGAGGLA